MNDFSHQIEAHTNVTEADQIAAGQQVQGDTSVKHQDFLTELFRLLDTNEIDPYAPSSMLKTDVYESLTEQKQDQIDLELINICNQVRIIQNFRTSNSKEIESIHFSTMIEHLWEMVNRIEIENDVFKF